MVSQTSYREVEVAVGRYTEFRRDGMKHLPKDCPRTRGSFVSNGDFGFYFPSNGGDPFVMPSDLDASDRRFRIRAIEKLIKIVSSGK